MHVLRFAAVAASAALVSLVGCSSSAPPLPLAYVNSLFVGPGSSGAACSYSSGTWIQIENAPSAPDDAVQTGETTDKGASVTVSCSVHANSDGSFAVTATATLGGLGGGGLTVSGTFTSMGTQMNIQGVFTRGDTGTYQENDCTVAYDKTGMGIAAGRVWGDLSCPNESRSGESTPESCAAQAEFKFENCLD